MLRAMNVEELNPHIICCLCGGYLVDATTIVECLHSFCRSCIVKYLLTSFHCPVCDVEVHKTKPLLHIRPDRTLQEIVYKLVPGLYQAELRLRREFEEKQRTESGETGETEPVKKDSVHDGVCIKDPVCITLEYYRRNRNWMEKQVFPTRYLRCSSAVTIRVLKTFLEMKFGIPRSHQVEIIRCDEILNDHLTMREVSRIYGLHAKSFLDLQYAFLEPSEDDTTTKQETAEKVPRKKRKIDKKKVKDTQVNAIQTELLSNDDKLESSRESEDLVKTFPDIPVTESDITTFPDTPPGSENVPYNIQIESPA